MSSSKSSGHILKRATGALQESVKGKNVLFRFDSGNDSLETLEAPLGKDGQAVGKTFREGRDIVIKWSLRQKNKGLWLSLAKEYGKGKMTRAGKIRHTGEVKLDCPANNRRPSLEAAFEASGP
jgi:hypothetical protein